MLTPTKKSIVLAFLADNPTLGNKEASERLHAMNHHIDADYIAQVKSGEKKKNEKSRVPHLDVNSIRHVLNLRAKIMELGGIEAVEKAIEVTKVLVSQVGSLEGVETIVAAVRELDGIPGPQ